MPSKKNKPAGSAEGKSASSAARMEAFALAYSVNPNGTEAAIKAGYAEKSAAATASRLLRNDKVKKRLAELADIQAAKAIADGRERRELLTKVLRNEVSDVAAGGKDLSWIHTPVPVSERTKAAIELAKMDGDYAAVKVDVKVTEYSRDWLKQTLQVVSKYVDADTLRKIAAEIPRFEP